MKIVEFDTYHGRTYAIRRGILGIYFYLLQNRTSHGRRWQWISSFHPWYYLTWSPSIEILQSEWDEYKKSKWFEQNQEIMMHTKFNEYIGQPLEVLEEAARRDGFVVRIRVEDGQSQVGTADIQLKRLNVAITGGLVTGIIGLG